MAIKADQLAMVMLVKNEIDIIDLNIRYHQSKGIQQFIVMDNGSTDGTLEYLKQLAKKIDMIVVDNPDKRYLQSKWMTSLARQARAEFGVTHVIPNDADEFWCPKDNLMLHEVVDADTVVQTVHRHNRVLTQKMETNGEPFYMADSFVLSPILYSGEEQKGNPAASMQLVKISPKVIVQPKGLIKIKGGNHRAKHWKVWKTGVNSQLTVQHFPIRSFNQFETNISGCAKKLGKPGVKMGPHIGRWVPQFNEGKLYEEYQHLVLTDDQTNVLKEIGVLEVDAELPKALSELMKEKPER